MQGDSFGGCIDRRSLSPTLGRIRSAGWRTHSANQRLSRCPAQWQVAPDQHNAHFIGLPVEMETMKRRNAVLLLLVLLAVEACGHGSDYDFGNDVFQIEITGNPDKAGNPKYTFTWDLGDGTAEVYDVSWEKVYETPCSDFEHASGNKMVNLNSLKWSYDFGDDGDVQTFSMDSGAVDSKLQWTSLRFNQEFNASVPKATHMKFSVELEGYQWQDDSDESCLLIEMSFKDKNDGLATCDQVNSNATMVGNGYVQQLPSQTCLAADPDSPATQDVNFELSCGSGNTIMFLYSSFPSGWDLVHDPNIGVNSETDPMYGFTFASDDPPEDVEGNEVPWGEIALIGAIGAVVVILIVVGMAGMYLLGRRARSGGYEPLDAP